MAMDTAILITVTAARTTDHITDPEASTTRLTTKSTSAVTQARAADAIKRIASQWISPPRITAPPTS